MKKFLLSCFIFLSGVMGVIGWLIASVTKYNGVSTSVIGCVSEQVDWVIIAAFVIVSVLGLLAAIREVKKER